MKRPWLLPLNPLWRFGTALKNRAYDRHILPVRHLHRPVIGIGSLSAGGAGKTPVVIALARLLATQGIAAGVLSRGYGRGSGAIEQVDPQGSPTRFGDEPLVIAQSATQLRLPSCPESFTNGVPHSSQSDEWDIRPTAHPIPVFVGASRHAAGQLAESALPQTQLHLLDDGFQHRRLARTLDLVLLTLADARDRLLPAGNLREPLNSLRRAHAILLREEEAAALAPIATRHAPHVRHWLIRRRLVLPTPRLTGALAFCGLARPQAFFADLRHAGCSLAATIPFPDHYIYTYEDITALCLAARRSFATAFLTTAKDAVKLPPTLRARLEAVAPLHVARLEVTFLDPSEVLETVRRACTLPGAPDAVDTDLSPDS